MEEVTTTVVPNDRGTEDVRIFVAVLDGAQLAKTIERAATEALKTHMRRREFSGQIQIVVPATIPVAERRNIPPVIERLRAMCAALSTGDAPFRVTLTYQRDPSASTLKADQVARIAAASASAPRTSRVSRRSRTRIWLSVGVTLVIAAVVAGWYLMSGPYPRSIEFGRVRMTKATDWELVGVTGGVYVLPGESLSNASLQVGVIVSTAHQTAKELDLWVRAKYIESGTTTFHNADNDSESCRIGESTGAGRSRVFLATQVCRTGIRRSACVEADDAIPRGVVTNCQALGSEKKKTACFDEICAERWAVRVDAMQQLAADFLTH